MDSNTLGVIVQAVAALGTFAAVIVAVWQGIKEGQRSSQLRHDDVRPVIVIVSPPEQMPLQNDRYLDWEHGQPEIEIRNVGKGIALNIRSVIYGPQAVAGKSHGNEWAYFSEDREKHWYYWTADVVPQGGPKHLSYKFADPVYSPVKFSEKHKYIKAKGKRHYSFNAPKQPLAPANQEECHVCRVIITYQDIFHRKHASIIDLVVQRGWKEWSTVALLDNVKTELHELVD